MTLAQFRLYTRAAARARRADLRERALAARAAQFDRQGWAQFMRSVESGE